MTAPGGRSAVEGTGASSAADAAADAAEFASYRDLLFTLSYEITGSVADAEDVVQESYLRWAGMDPAERDRVVNRRAYLARIATRQALNRVRSRTRLREEYVGPWLPEPLVTEPDIADDVVLADSVSMAMMLVVQSLSPDERAVFVLHEVFGFAHDEIADAIGKSPAAVRQIAHRARSHVRARRPRAHVPPDEPPVSDLPEVAQRFLHATATGDLQGLMDVLAPDVVLLSDGGGKVKAALRPVVSADHVARLLVGLREKALRDDGSGAIRYEPRTVNGRPGALVFINGNLETVATAEVAGNRVVAVYLVRNPVKLAAAANVHRPGR
jgi:RNA polymerase sigma-70 factor (ECF subfamily)